MHKRFIRVDIEYDMDVNPVRLHSFAVIDSIKRAIEVLPSTKVLFSRDSPDREALDKPVGERRER